MDHPIAHALFCVCRGLGARRPRRRASFWLAVPFVLLASGAAAAPEDLPIGSFVLKTDPMQNVSLQANQASLEAILEELARKLGVEVENRAGADKLVVSEFSGLPLPKALKRLSENTMIVSDESSGQAARIILLPSGDGTRYVPPPAAAEPVEPDTLDEEIPEAQGGSFEFTFDPDAVPIEDPDGQSPEDPTEDFETEMQEDLEDE